MSSTSMLEQAFIDAESLKETALKNAEQLIIEKYSTELKEAVENLLEQEDEEGNTETDNLTCSVQSADAILCYGTETEETVDLDGNVLERVERCLELSLNLVAD